jgi:2',3'-cyclic-nucleotide 2'-phosphodiesterase (5'-nucleotidase family)
MTSRYKVSVVVLGALLLGSCGGAPGATKSAQAHDDSAAAAPKSVVITLLGTNDLHGRIERAALYGGYVERMREVRAKDGGVLLVEGGDLFQGTLESNANEGASVIAAYNAIGMTASSIGNHEFDYGPVGPLMAPATTADDPRGALKARIEQAKFPFVNANLWMKEGEARVNLPNVVPHVVVEVAGVKVGIVGLATEETLTTTMAANVADLRVEPSATAVLREVKALRDAGAEIVIGIGHLGGKCKDTKNPHDLSSCAKDEEVFRLMAALPPKTLDAFVGGHTHNLVAHFVNGVAVIESGALGWAFGRVDFVFDTRARRVNSVQIHEPRPLCAEAQDPCVAGEYEGARIEPSKAALAAVVPYLAEAAKRRDDDLGVEVKDTFERSGAYETALGNLLADLALTARPTADLALVNGGGIRAPLAPGPLTYGEFYEVFPFDNRFASVVVTGAEFKELVLENVNSSHSVISIAGMTAAVTCKRGKPVVDLRRASGKPVRDGEKLTVLTSDFVVTGGDSLFSTTNYVIEDGPPMREEMVKVLRARAGSLSASDPVLFDAKHRRFSYPSRPLACEAP